MTPERIEELLALHAAGASGRKIALAMGLHQRRVWQQLRDARAAGVISAPAKEVPKRAHDQGPEPTEAELPALIAPHTTDAWPAARVLALCLGWRAGKRASALATELQAGKNAIIGKVHRMVEFGVLRPRPSPIQTKKPAAESPAKRTPSRPAASGLGSVDVPPTAVAGGAEWSAGPAPSPPPRLTPRPYARIGDCCWPFGHPGTASFRFCGDPADPGRPYCADHVRVAYVSVRMAPVTASAS